MPETKLNRLVRKGNGVRKYYGIYRCVCGVDKEIQDGSVRSGATRSCGCLYKETSIVLGRGNRKHGRSGTPEYRAWYHLVRRCTDSSDNSFGDYGGRGITVAEEWLGEGGFEKFLAHVGPRPSPKHSIDRIKNNEGYEPGNVRWATWEEQHRNKRNNRLVAWDGRIASLVEWAEETGINYQTLRYRFGRGWSAGKVFTTPVRVGKTDARSSEHG